MAVSISSSQVSRRLETAKTLAIREEIFSSIRPTPGARSHVNGQYSSTPIPHSSHPTHRFGRHLSPPGPPGHPIVRSESPANPTLSRSATLPPRHCLRCPAALPPPAVPSLFTEIDLSYDKIPSLSHVYLHPSHTSAAAPPPEERLAWGVGGALPTRQPPPNRLPRWLCEKTVVISRSPLSRKNL